MRPGIFPNCAVSDKIPRKNKVKDLTLMNKLKPRSLRLTVIDILTLVISYAFTSLFTGGYSPDMSAGSFLLHGAILLVCVFGVRTASGIYLKLWRYAQFDDYLLLILSDTAAGLLFAAIEYLILGNVSEITPLPFYAMMLPVMFSLIAALGVRTSYQLYRKFKNAKEIKNHSSEAEAEKKDDKIRIAIIGAGTKGVQLAEMLRSQPDAKYEPYCFIDTDAHKIGATINGLKVYAGDEAEFDTIKNMPVDEVIIAINNISESLRATLFKIYTEAGKKVRIYDYPLGASYGKKSLTVRDINIEDLLFRYSVDFSNEKLFEYYTGKTVLVTGGGGTIGSELCRQVAKTSPKKLIILDIYENNAYEIQQELKRQYGDSLDLCVEIASIREADKMNLLFAKYRPDVVFHAAAHKHVPLMEDCCDEAVKNNIFGTYNVVNAAEAYGVSKFIMISTDKAVNPTNIMGATKRFCERIIQSRKDSKTCFVAVRFGNVLGSNGSVIPLFMKQIEEGGPVTITDNRIIRYFMTIKEASQLVMAAGASARKSEIYVLDMGKPVKILDLAVNMIRLAGYTPYEDIKIEQIGLRPGEKLYEELLLSSEKLDKTENEKIFIERDACPSRDEIEQKMILLRRAVASKNCMLIREVMRQIVPTYHDAAFVNRNAERSKEMHLCLDGEEAKIVREDMESEETVKLS